MTQIIFRPAAAADVEDAFRWYERQRVGLGNEFLAAIESTLHDVAEQPARYALIHRGTRRVLVHRFPYGIFYRVYGEVVVVVACMHGRRDPRRWKSRTGS
jgi:plasmid stabilization system protein ParE